eukprot:540507-Hanusia_phi.AAC.3
MHGRGGTYRALRRGRLGNGPRPAPLKECRKLQSGRALVVSLTEYPGGGTAGAGYGHRHRPGSEVPGTVRSPVPGAESNGVH